MLRKDKTNSLNNNDMDVGRWFDGWSLIRTHCIWEKDNKTE